MDLLGPWCFIGKLESVFEFLCRKPANDGNEI